MHMTNNKDGSNYLVSFMIHSPVFMSLSFSVSIYIYYMTKNIVSSNLKIRKKTHTDKETHSDSCWNRYLLKCQQKEFLCWPKSASI